jgi:hypothetical protein
VDASGEDVYVDLDSAGGASHSGDGHGDDAEADGGEQHCHEHAGIP